MSTFITFLLLAAFLLGNLVKPSFLSPDIHVSFADVSVALIWLIALVARPRQMVAQLRRSSLLLPALSFIVVALFSLLVFGRSYGSMAQVVGSLYLVRWELFALLFLPLSALLTSRQARVLLWVLGAAVVIAGLAQYLLMPDIRHLSLSDWDPHYYRVVGSFLDPGYTGLLLVFALLSLLPRTKFSSRNPSAAPGSKPAAFSLLSPPPSLPWLMTYLTLAFTYSRSSFLAFLAAFSHLAIFKKSWRLFLSALTLLLVTLVVLPRAPDGEGVKLERISSIQARIINWKNSLTIFSHHPVFGVGFNVYRYAQRSYGFLPDSNWQRSHGGAGADSSFLFVAATTGSVGLIAYLWFLSRLWHAGQTFPLFKATLVALFIHSWFLNSLFYPFVLIWISVWVSLLTSSNSPSAE